MNGTPWSAEEYLRLEILVGDAPAAVAHKRYLDWARLNGYPERSQASFEQTAKRLGLQLRSTGELLPLARAAAIAGFSRGRVAGWVSRGLLPTRRHGRNVYVSRLALRRLARKMPWLFGGTEQWHLFQLLEDEALATSIAEQYPRTLSARKRARCVERGVIYPSIVAAAKAHYVHRRAITWAASKGCRAAGYHWELVA